MTVNRTTETARDYDRDPEALAWARAKVQRDIGRFREFERHSAARGDADRAEWWGRLAGMLQDGYIGGEGCVIAAFDERLPSLPPRDGPAW
jgi:hypothetical protein